MRLDRYINDNDHGKYAVVKLRKLDAVPDTQRAPLDEAMKLLANAGVLTYGLIGAEDEFFVMMLKDINARSGLIGYAERARFSDPQYADDVERLANRAGARSPYRKDPD